MFIPSSIYKSGECFSWAQLLLTSSWPSTLTDVAHLFIEADASASWHGHGHLTHGVDMWTLENCQLTCHQHLFKGILQQYPVRLTSASWHLTPEQVGRSDMWTLENFSSPLPSCAHPLPTDCLHRLFVPLQIPATDSHTVLWPGKKSFPDYAQIFSYFGDSLPRSAEWAGISLMETRNVCYF